MIPAIVLQTQINKYKTIAPPKPSKLKQGSGDRSEGDAKRRQPERIGVLGLGCGEKNKTLCF